MFVITMVTLQKTTVSNFIVKTYNKKETVEKYTKHLQERPPFVIDFKRVTCRFLPAKTLGAERVHYLLRSREWTLKQ